MSNKKVIILESTRRPAVDSLNSCLRAVLSACPAILAQLATIQAQYKTGCFHG